MTDQHRDIEKRLAIASIVFAAGGKVVVPKDVIIDAFDFELSVEHDGDGGLVYSSEFRRGPQ